MVNRDIIQSSVDYIEENLKTEITAQELAEKAGFSLFHYYRIFQDLIGMPVMQYVLRRRLANAIFEIGCGGRMIDVALSFGFDTHAGFFKAFRREYDCSPSQYIKRRTFKKPARINLKQEVSTMITHKKIADMLTNWDLENEKISTFYYESCSIESQSTWYIGNEYILKTGTSLTALKQHIVIARAVADAGMEATVPVATKEGRDYAMDGETYYCLTTRPKGKCVMAGGMYTDNYGETARQIGEILGKLHLVLKKHDKDIISNDNDILEAVTGWAMPETKKAINLPDSFYDDYHITFDKLCPKLPKQVIHRDPHPSVFIIRDNKIHGFIEFEMSERNIRLFDPCYAATAILSESFDEGNTENLGKWVEIYKNIILGYDSICRLTNEEKQALPYVVYSIEMICLAYFSGNDKFPGFAEIDKRMLKWLSENKEKLVIEF